MAYNPYNELKAVYDAKVAWSNATTDEERQKQSTIANNARQKLIDNDYGYLAEQVSAAGADVNAAKKILDQWAPKTATTTTTSAASPYNELQRVYNAKVAWGNATTDAERQTQSGIASDARQKLTDSGYGYLAEQVSADGATADAVKKILDSWAPKVDTTTGNYKTGVSNPAYNQEMAAASKKNDARDAMITQDHDNINSKYNDLFSYANQDLTQTDEYKSAFANIMPSYTLAAMQGRDNEIASGAATNGGNIDSFAAANASRQQAALTAKGQSLAHQMGLESVNARVNNAKGILSDMGVYNSSVYSALQDGVNNSRGIANDIFNNEETAKNNQVSRDIAVSELAGELTSGLLYQLPEYSQFFNTDGTLKNPNIDYTTEIKKAEEAGNTRLAEVLKVARGAKIWGDYAQYGQYDDGNYTLPGKHITESARIDDAKIEQTNKLAGIESDEKQKDRDHEINKLVVGSNLGVTGGGNEEQTKLEVDSTISNWLYSPWADLKKSSIYKGQDPDVHVVYYAAQKINDPEILSDIKKGLTNAGYTAAQVTSKIAEYRDNIAKQILKAEGIPTNAADYKDRLADVKSKHNLN